MKKKMRIGVIGGGASGMFAALTAAKAGAEVSILEGNDRVGRKILSTGNGKCNLANRDLDASKYYGSDRAFIEHVLERFAVEDAVRSFEEMGLLIKDKNGYLYPSCEQANVVLDVLRLALAKEGVKVVTECKVTGVFPDGRGGFKVTDGSRKMLFDKVIIACGSKAAPVTGSDGTGYTLAKQLGHSILRVVPALVQLTCKEDYIKQVSGVRSEARVSLTDGDSILASEEGELQLADYGISGIVVFQLSRIANYMLRDGEVNVKIDLLPHFSDEEYEKLIAEREVLREGRTVEEFFLGLVNKKITQLFIKMAGLKPTAPADSADEKSIRRFYELVRDWRVTVNGSKSFENAQVCAGGVNTAELNEDLESVYCPGVYFAGEIMDVDGKCGGYNLQWAWSTGYIAGSAAARNE